MTLIPPALIRCDHAANGPRGLHWDAPGDIVEVTDEKLRDSLLKIEGFSEVLDADPDYSAHGSVTEDDHEPIPPKAGRGSGVDAWREYAAAHDVEVDERATRDEIIEALEAKGIPTE